MVPAMRALLLAPLALTLGCMVPESTAGDADAAAVDAVRVDDLGADKPDVGFTLDAGVVATEDVAPPRDLPVVAPTVARWVLPRPADGDVHEPFALPWPNDLSRDSAGLLDLSFFPTAGVHPLVTQYLRTFNHRLRGFSPIAAVYFTFGMDLDPGSLPADAAATRNAESPLQLIDVDPRSPDRGARIPLQWFFRGAATRYWPAHSLAVAPVFGFPMRPATRYALVVTNTVRGVGSVALRRDVDLDRMLTDDATTDPAIRAAREVYAPALAEIERAGVMRERVLSLTTFTTDDPTAEFFRAADWIHREGAAPALIDLGAPTDGPSFTTLRGHYGPNLVFQSGATPYNVEGSGDFVLGPDGTPRQQRTEPIRFALTLPLTPMPAGGYPLAIYAHGTGGDYQSFIRDRSAQALAAQGVAVLGFDQIFHGERSTPGTSEESAFFNFTNPSAGRTNNRQAALDLVQSGRFARLFSFPLTDADGGVARTVRFDPDHIMYFGHSQGGLNGPLWLAADDGAGAAVLSGAGGSIAIALLEKTEPVNIPALIMSALGLSAGEFVVLHPVVSLLQMLVDPSDPVNYGRYIIREPRPTMHPAHIFQTQGFIDHYAPPAGIAALALSIGLPLTVPTVHPEASFALAGDGVLSVLPLHGNLGAASSPVTGSWMQFMADPGRDGHFVAFDIPDARLRAAAFLGSAGRDPAGVPTVPAMIPME
ncbi:MAG: putative extracellular enzyme of alpha/beta hydrolase superfamily [Myxococcaceae bacterium]|nr:putative extracellular enzyme of alpha/beta hydrolase superfamily [Myxococcaceae bacterium]